MTLAPRLIRLHVEETRKTTRKTMKTIRNRAADPVCPLCAHSETGDDPAQDKQERRDALTFKYLAKSYLEMARRRHRRWDEEERIVNKDLVPEFGHRLLIDIRRRDVRELVEGIVRKRDAPVMANRPLRLLSCMFNYALDREWIEASPAARIPEPGEEQSRDRVLDDQELRELWLTLDEIARHVEPGEAPKSDDAPEVKLPITPATAEAFQIQLLTAQRPGEVRLMRWADVNLESAWWSIPGSLTKNAVSILSARHDQANKDANFVFENRPGAGSIHDRGKKAAAALSKTLTFSFRAHDLRRTVATRMAAAGIPHDHVAKVLNHVQAGQSATRVYDRYDYDTEKRAALDRWLQRLTAIVEGKTAKVVAMTGRR